MATIYEFKIKTVSAFCAHPKEDVKKLIEDFIKNYKFENGMGFESTEITDMPFCKIKEEQNEKDNFMSNIRKCPNCIQSARDAYQQGYADAMKLYQEEILKALQSRPIQYPWPENWCITPYSGGDTEAKESTKKNTLIISDCVECANWSPANSLGCGCICQESNKVVYDSYCGDEMPIPDDCPLLKGENK